MLKQQVKILTKKLDLKKIKKSKSYNQPDESIDCTEEM